MEKHCQILKTLYGQDSVDEALFFEKKLHLQCVAAPAVSTAALPAARTIGHFLKSCHCSSVDHVFIGLSIYSMMFIDAAALEDRQYIALLRPMQKYGCLQTKNLKFQLLYSYLQGRKHRCGHIFGQILKAFSDQRKKYVYKKKDIMTHSVKRYCDAHRLQKVFLNYYLL